MSAVPMDLVHRAVYSFSMAVVNLRTAKMQLSRLLARVAAGETIIIAKAGKPIARLVPCEEPVRKRVPGLHAGRVWIAPDFDGPLPEDLLSGFHAGESP